MREQTADLTSRFRRLRAYNAVMALLHLVQGIAVVVLSTDFTLPVTAAFIAGPPGTTAAITTLFELHVGWGVALFLFMSAVAHLILVLPRVNGWYNANLQRNRNYARWIEYAFSSSLMVILIAMLPGITDFAALVAIFGANASMNLFGWLMERYETPGPEASWISYWFGVLAGITPWIAIGVYLISPGSDVQPPAFVYGIFFSLFVFFNTFAINMVLQYRKVGRWKNYLFGESVYVLLSLVSKSLLAWQVFAGTLVPT